MVFLVLHLLVLLLCDFGAAYCYLLFPEVRLALELVRAGSHNEHCNPERKRQHKDNDVDDVHGVRCVDAQEEKRCPNCTQHAVDEKKYDGDNDVEPPGAVIEAVIVRSVRLVVWLLFLNVFIWHVVDLRVLWLLLLYH